MSEARSKGGRPARDHLDKNARTGEFHRVRWIVPKHLIDIVGKPVLLRPLPRPTTIRHEAERQSYAFNAECQAIIEDAERQLRGEPKPRYQWPDTGQGARWLSSPPPDHVVAAGERYQAFMQREREISARHRRGEPEKTADFDSIIDEWIREKNPRAGSINAYRSVMRQLRKYLGHSDARRVLSEQCAAYKKHLFDAGKSNATVKNHVLVIRGLFGFALDNVIIPSNPAASLTIPEVESERRSFTPEELKLVLLESRKEEPLVRWTTWACAFSGARLSEISKAAKSDIEIEGKYVVVNVPKDRAKNGKHRRFPLHSSVIREGFLDYLATVPDGGLLFPDRKGWNHSTLVNNFQKRIGITDKNVKFHSHRHTFYSLANELIDGENERIPERFAEKIAGHSDGRASRKYGDVPIATLAKYVEQLPDPTLEVAERVAA